jgi:SAM-dependent methyltransferase
LPSRIGETMTATNLNSTTRFSSRVADYVKFRPDYPRQILACLRQDIGLTADWLVADVACGTGISSRMFLENGNRVIGVEPNDDMRAAAVNEFATNPRFTAVKGTAEATTLANASVDLVVAAQAFHWFDRQAAAREFERILRPLPGGYVVAMWNDRSLTSAFAREYDQMLRGLGKDYEQVSRNREIDCHEFEQLFDSQFTKYLIPNEQVFNLAGLQGRVGSCSYAPLPGQNGFHEMSAELGRLFARHQQEGLVRFEYQTEVFVGRAAR